MLNVWVLQDALSYKHHRGLKTPIIQVVVGRNPAANHEIEAHERLVRQSPTIPSSR